MSTLTKRKRIGLWAAVLLTAAVGVVNLLSAVTPSVPERVEMVQEIFPFPIRAGGHLFAALSGFILLTLSASLLRRKRVAWLLTIGLLIVSIFSNLIKGWDYEEGILSAILLTQLLLLQPIFTARSDRPSIAQGVQVLLAALIFTLAYGAAGFYILDGVSSLTGNLSILALPSLCSRPWRCSLQETMRSWSRKDGLQTFLQILSTWWVL